MSEADAEKILQANPVFGCLDTEDRGRLLASSQRKTYAARQTIFHKDDPGAFMLALLSGSVRVCLYSPEGREITLNVIEPGQVLGEIAVLDGQPRTAYATAIGPVEALVFDRRDVLALLQDRPSAAIRMLEMLCGRLRRTSGQVEAVAFHDLPSRLAMLLFSLADECGVATPEGTRIERPLAQRDLARLIGSTRESVNRQMRSWIADGLVASEGGIVTLRDRDGLALLLPDQFD